MSCLAKCLGGVIFLWLNLIGCKTRFYNSTSKTNELKTENVLDRNYLQTELSKWTNAQGQTVILLDTVHLGPKEYYNKLNAALLNIELANKNKKIAFAMEGVTCSGKVWVFDNGSQFLPAYWPNWKRDNNFEVPPFTDSNWKLLLEKKIIKMIGCSEPREVGKAYKNLDYCKGLSRKWACQQNALVFPERWTPWFVDSDLSSWSPQLQLALAMAIDSGRVLSGNKATVEWWISPLPGEKEPYSPQSIFWDNQILIQRNQEAWLKSQQAFNSGYQVIVFPWGADHSKGFINLIKQAGFQLAGAKVRIPYAECSFVQALSNFRSFFYTYQTHCLNEAL